MKYTAAALAAIIGYAAAQDTYGSNCPTPGTTGSDGRYSCNPAHTYPDGQQCQEDGGCYYLTQPGPGVTAPAEYPTTTSTATGYAPTSSCPAPGTNGPDGRYSCNPAHQYPEGQICQEDGGCYYLRIPGPGVSTSVPSYPSATPSKGACPAPGSTGPDGRYSCNPAHTYPDGQICQEDGGCYYLRSPGPGVSVSVPSHYTTEVETAYTTYCPSPTTFAHEQKTYTVTKPTTVTLPCEKGCTVTKPVYGPTVSVPPTAPVVTPSKPVAPTTPVYKPTGNGTQTHSIATYTGGAASFATAAPLAMAALGAFFL